MAAKVIALCQTRELDVIVRRAPGHRDLRDQVGILFLDSRADGTVFRATFEPIYERIPNLLIDVSDLHETTERVIVVDEEDDSRWHFEINALDEEE